VYDEKFHSGLNVIRGENGSGKTTIADFIFFALGGDTPQWRAEAALCEYVFAEVKINGEPATLRRQVDPALKRPMAIFWGSFEKAESSQTDWQLYQYSATSGKESFSQALFHIAGIPEVKGQLAARVTMHQILRLMYVDQKTDYEQIFRFDPFDQGITREAVGDLLCGVYDDRLYEDQIKLSEKQDEKARLRSELKTIFALFGDQGVPDSAAIEIDRSGSQLARDQAYAQLEVLPTQPVRQGIDAIARRRSEIAEALGEQNQVVRQLEGLIAEAKVEVADREQFLAALRARLQALQESEAIHESLGVFSFEFCPSCHAPLERQDDTCRLCKSPLESRPGQNLLRLRNELSQQIAESEAMQQSLSRRAEQLSQQLRPAEELQRKLQLEYNEISTEPLTPIDAAAGEIHRRIGYLDRKMEDLERLSKVAERVSAITAREAVLASEISRLNDEIEARTAQQEDRKHDVAALIAKSTTDFLRRDLPREGAFTHAISLNFNFGTNRLSVDGRSTFAASSNVYLKNVFHLALLNASAIREYMRYPRLVIFDNVEDKGMEQERSHNFQRIVWELSSSLDVEHQIILFTSMIDPQIEAEPNLLIGEHYTHEHKTLRVAPVAGTVLPMD
jgi:hypothetical protein